MTYHLYSNSTGRSIFHGHGKPGGGGHPKGQGNVIILQNIHDELQGPPPLIHIPVFILLWFSPHSSLFWPTDMDMDEVIREDKAQAVHIWREQEWKEDTKV